MKHVSSFQKIITGFILLVSIGLVSCSKKNTPEATVPTGTLYLHLHTNIDTTEVEDYGSIDLDAQGRRMYLNLAQLYISGITLAKADNSIVTIDNAVILKVKDTEEYLMGNIPAGNYSSIAFNVGLDASTNQKAPTTYTKPNPLAVQDTSMWFGSTAQGYIFVNVQGGVDTTLTQNASKDKFQPFNFQLGTGDELKSVSMPVKAFTVVPNQPQLVHLIIDYSLLLKGLNLKTQNSATPFTNKMLADQVAGNIPSMFRYEY